MRCLIVAGGAPDDLPDDALSLGAFDSIVCADGGVYNARRLGLAPQVVVGDLDSLAADEQERLRAVGCTFVVHPAAKDETDLELALHWCRESGATAVTVLGAFGGRPDHLLANILLATDPALRSMQVRLRSRHWEVWLAERDAVIDGQPGDIVSLLPLSQRVTGITTEGLEYPLRGETLRLGPARGVSNVMLGKMARVAHRSGLLLIMHGPGAEGRQQA